MVKATGKLRTFDVELRQEGTDPRVLARDVSLEEARSVCQQWVGPSGHAVVKPREERLPVDPDAEPRYAIWLWNESQLRWERLRRHQQFTLREAAAWLEKHSDAMRDRLTLVAPSHLRY